jgi:hemolysin D
MIRIVIADDQTSIRLALQAQLKSYPDIEVVGMAENGRQAIEQVAKLMPDVLLLDLEMPVLNGLGAAKEIKVRFPATKLLVLTAQNDPSALLPALRVGVHGYLYKGIPPEELVEAIRSVGQGHFQIGPNLATSSAAASEVGSLENTMAGGTMVIAPPDISSLNGTKPSNGEIVASPGGSLTKAAPSSIAVFDRPVLLQQSPVWSRVIIWGLVGSTAAVLAWASWFKFDEAIPAAGQLEPQGAVKEVQAPVAGVVKAILVKEGQKVKKGDVLLRLDPKGTQSELASLGQVRQSLLEENAFYRQQLANETGRIDFPSSRVLVPSRMLALAQSRQALIEESQLYRSQVRGNAQDASLSPEQQMRLQSSLQEEYSRANAARLESEQLQKQLLQTQIQKASAFKSLVANTGLLETIKPVVASGGLAKLEQIKQEESVQKSQADVDRLGEEEARLRLAIAQANEKLDNTVSVSRKDVLGTLSVNDKQIAQIDSQFAKTIVENEKQISEIENKLTQAKLTLNYQEIKSPADGLVFDLKPNAPGFVANPTEPILKIVPSDNLLAKVYITNKDIGFVRPGMDVDVRVDSFPLSEFGDIKGKLTWVGSDALPPTQVRNFYSFPAKVKLNTQTLKKANLQLPLQSGMSLSVNIKTRQRTVMSIFTDLFTGQVEGMKNLR